MSAVGSDIAKTATEAGGFLKNYCEPRPCGDEVGDLSYERGSILKGQEGKQKEYKSLVDCDLSALSWKIMDKFRIFACACLNAAEPGTIYFGVADNKKKKHEHGEILGLPVNNIKDDIMDAFQRVLNDHIQSDEGKLKRGGDQNCFKIYFVPVKIPGMHSELYVVEIEVVRDWDYCKDNVYYFREWTERPMQKGGKDSKSKMALNDLYKVKQDHWDNVYIRTNNASSCVRHWEVDVDVRKPLKVKFDRREPLVQLAKGSGAVDVGCKSVESPVRHRNAEATGNQSCSTECSMLAMDQKAPIVNSKHSDHASAQPGSTSANKSEQLVENNGWKLLHAAVQSGDIDTISTILSLGCDIDSRDSDGKTPLMSAAERLNAFNLLLERDADPTLKDNNKWTVLHYAAHGGNEEIIEKILSFGLDIDSRNSGGVTPLMSAACQGRLNAINLLLEKGADLNLKNNNKWTVLHCAAQGGNEEIIEKILSFGLDIDSRSSDGLTPLMIAAHNGRLNAFNLLLEKGADLTLKGNDKWTVLHCAARGGNEEIIKKLLSLGLDIDSRDSYGVTPLISAACQGRLNAFNLLLERGADATLKINNGSTVLHWAAEGGKDEIIEKLLSLGLDIDSRNSDGLTPLMSAAANGRLNAFNLLLERGADATFKKNNGLTVLHCAAEGGKDEMIEKLLSLGLDIDSGDSDGVTPLMIAACQGRLNAFNLLLERGADVTLEDNDGWTVLHCAAQGANDEIIEKLLSLGLDINSRKSDGATPLMIAAAHGRLNAFNFLLERDADPTLKKNSGWTVLHSAAQGGKDEIIEKLLSLGLDINSRENNGKTPLIIATSHGKAGAVKYLLSKGAR